MCLNINRLPLKQLLLPINKPKRSKKTERPTQIPKNIKIETFRQTEKTHHLTHCNTYLIIGIMYIRLEDNNIAIVRIIEKIEFRLVYIGSITNIKTVVRSPLKLNDKI